MFTWRPRTTDLRATNCWVVAAWSERRTQLLRGSRALQNWRPGLSASYATRWLGTTHPTCRHHWLLIQKTEIMGASISKDGSSLKKWESAETPGMETAYCVRTPRLCVQAPAEHPSPLPGFCFWLSPQEQGQEEKFLWRSWDVGEYWNIENVEFPRTELKKKKASSTRMVNGEREPGRGKSEGGGQGCLGSEPEWCGDSGWWGCTFVSWMEEGAKSSERSSHLTLTRNPRLCPGLITHDAFHFTTLYHHVYHYDDTSNPLLTLSQPSFCLCFHTEYFYHLIGPIRVYKVFTRSSHDVETSF